MNIQKHIEEWSEQIGPWLTTHGLKILIIIVAVFVTRLLLLKILSKAIRVAIVADSDSDHEGEIKREHTLIYIFSATISIALYLVGILMILDEMGLEIGPLLAGAGIVGLALGFGGQYLIRDIIAGLFIIIENQYRIGDVIRIEETEGLVENISLRMTTLRDINGTVHHIPHGEIKMVSNLSKSFARVNIELGVAYSSNLDQVIAVINETGNQLFDDREWKDKMISPPQFVRVNEFADSAIIVKIVGDTQPHKQWEVAGEYRKRLKTAFDLAGIEIPFPQVVVHQAKP